MSNIHYQTDLIYGLNEIVTEPGSLGIGVVRDEGKVRFVITGAGASNEVLVRGRINNQQTWNTLATFTGNINDLVEVFTYDELEVICTVFDPVNGYDFRLVASSFDSNNLTIVTPDGTLDNFNTLTLTSLDETILFNTDPLTGSIDLSAVGGGGGGGYQAYANLAAFPAVGTVGIIYVANDTKKIYRWLSPSYIELSPSPVTSVNTETGDVVLDKADIGLGNVDNTSDLNKPISTATQTAITKKIITFTTADWTLSVDEYVLSVAAATHTKGVNPEVIVLENTGTEFAEVILYKAINASGDLTLAVSATPDNRFAGKLIIS